MERTIEIEGLKIRYLEEGFGPSIILLHGASLGSSSDVFEKTLVVLAQGGFRALAYDQPGFGRSDNPNDYTVSFRTGFITKFMDALNIDKATLVGHSQAGGMAARIALEQPKRVSHLIVAGSGSILPSLPDQKAKGGSREGREGAMGEPTLEDTKKLLEENLFNKFLITQEVLEKRYQMSLGKNLEAFIQRGQMRESLKEAMPLNQRLAELSMPLLMLYGFNDRGSAAKKCELLKAKDPSLRIEILNNAGHLLFWDAPDEFHEKVLAFLSN